MITQILSTALLSLSLATGVETSNYHYSTNYELLYNKINELYDNDPTISNIEDIYNLVGENRYLKVDIYDNYYIIDKEYYDIIDNGLIREDPYKNYTGLKLYLDSNSDFKFLGLANDKIYDLRTLWEINFGEMYENNKAMAIPVNGDYEDLRGEDEMFYTSDDIKYSSNTVFCDNYFYFEKLNSRHQTTNDDDTCMVISFEILLSYYDTFLNDNIVDEEFEIKSYEYSTDIDSFNVSPGVGDSDINRFFHDYLIDNHSPVSHSLKNEQQRTMIKSYINEKKFNVKYNYCMGNNLSDLLTNYVIKIIKNSINAGRPLIANDYDHSLVAYAYDDDYVYLHSGWGYVVRMKWKFFKPDFSYDFFLDFGSYDWSDPGAFDIVFNLEHVHSDNYYSTYYKEGICPCGECHNHSIENICIDDEYHINCCECGLYQMNKHHYIVDGYIKKVYISLLKKYMEIPVITRIYCDVCNHDKEGE